MVQCPTDGLNISADSKNKSVVYSLSNILLWSKKLRLKEQF